MAAAFGRVLDVGAGVGAIAFPMVRAGLDVTALEVLPEAVAYLRKRGVIDVRLGGVEALDADDRFDTIVCLMNGVGLAGSLSGVPAFLRALERHLRPGGTILLDSTDPSEWDAPDDGRAVGELHMQLGFDGEWGPPFPYLYASPAELFGAAAGVGLIGTVVARTGDDRYLAEFQRTRRAESKRTHLEE